MHEEGIETPQPAGQPRAFAFDGWSMVPLEFTRPPAEQPAPEPKEQPA